MNELDKESCELPKKLDKESLIQNSPEYLYDEKDFRLNMLEDQMASEKLSEGITGFSKAIEELEDLLVRRFEEVCNDNLIKI